MLTATTAFFININQNSALGCSLGICFSVCQKQQEQLPGFGCWDWVVLVCSWAGFILNALSPGLGALPSIPALLPAQAAGSCPLPRGGRAVSPGVSLPPCARPPLPWPRSHGSVAPLVCDFELWPLLSAVFTQCQGSEGQGVAAFPGDLGWEGLDPAASEAFPPCGSTLCEAPHRSCSWRRFGVPSPPNPWCC